MTNKPEAVHNVQRNFSVPDELLATLVTLINKNGGDMTITISMKGTVLSGKIISGKEYFKLLSIGTATATLSDEKGKGFRDGLAVAFANATKLYPQIDGNNTDIVDAAYDSVPTTYLHLKNVYVVTGNILPDDKGVWRLKLSEIDGWTLSSAIRRQD